MAEQGQSRFHSPVDDPASSYYLHPSEGPGLSLVSQPLIGDNYTTWSRAFKMAITIKNKLGFLDGSIPQPDNGTSPVIQNACLRNNNLVFAWIYNSLSKEIQASVLFTTYAKEIWDELATRFCQNNGPRLFQLSKELVTLAQNDLTITQYYTKMKGIWDELVFFMPVCSCGSCVCGGLHKIGTYLENELVLYFLMGLSEAYHNTTSQILLMDPLPPINKVFSMMVQEERQRSVLSSNTSAGAIFGLATRTDQGRKGISNFKKKERPMCSHCHLPGHTVDQCFKLHGYPPGYKAKFKAKPGGGVANQVGFHETDKDSTYNDHSANQLHSIFQNLNNDQCQQLVQFLSNKTSTSAATQEIEYSS